jgi:hypothetical protein
LNEFIMRITRTLFALGWFLAAAFSPPVLLSGCGNSNSLTSEQVEANRKEQQLLHDNMQKGFAKRPVMKRR